MSKTYRTAIIGCGKRAIGSYDSPPTSTNQSHAGAFMKCERTELVAAADFREEALSSVEAMYEVSRDHLYKDYRELIDKEKPEIVSIGTQEEQRSEITVYAAENGVKGIYAEKPMAASMEEVEAMVDAVERNGVAFNLGTNRRWSPGYQKVRDLANSGELGELKTIVSHNMDPIFISGSHWLDLIQFLNCDRRAVSVQALLTRGQDMIDGETVKADPGGYGIIQYENGVTAYAINTPRGFEQEVICENGAISVFFNGRTWSIRRRDISSDRDSLPNNDSMGELEFIRSETTSRIILDIVNSLDTGEPTQGGVRSAKASAELIFAFIESHVNGGVPIDLPLKNCTLRLRREYNPQSSIFRPQGMKQLTIERGLNMPSYFG